MSDSPLVIAHHGSPGGPKDFTLLKEQLKNFDWFKTNRYKDEFSLDKKVHQSIQMGYSFGSYFALKEASENLENTQALVLIAPYLFPTKKMEGLGKLILNLPILGNLILGSKASEAIEDMLKDSSAPLDPPEFYIQQKSYLSDTEVLKPALFEKSVPQSDVISMLKKIDGKIPVLLIYGDHDDQKNDHYQFKTIKENLKNLTEIKLNHAGHALTYTHPERLAQEINSFLNTENENLPKTDDSKPFGYMPNKHQLNNVCSFLEKHVKEVPQKPILSWVSPETLASWSGNLDDELKHDSVSVVELNQLVGVIGEGFKRLGIKSGDRVIVFVPMSLYMYAAMFALQKIGAVAVFLDSWARKDQMGVAADVAQANGIISVEKAFMYFQDVEQIQNIPIKICVGPAQGQYDARLEELMKTQGFASAQEVEQEHTALITFTTGSSGTPKGADRSHRFLAAQHYALNKHIPYEPNDADLPVFPIFSLNNLAAGVKTVIPAIDVGVPSDKDALILIAQMKSTNTTCTTLSPSLLRAVYNFCLEKNITLPFLKRIVTGGAPVSRDDLIATVKIAPNAEVQVLYGSTEVEPMAHIEAKEMIAQKESDDPQWVDEGVNVGKFDSGLEVRYLKIIKEPVYIKQASDWDNLLIAQGEVGEIIVSGEHVCERYYNNEEAFFKAKIKDENGVVWHRTGDLGRVDEKGNLWLVGRVHNAINRGGKYQFPVRAEIILKKLEFVEKAAFLGMPDDELGEKTYAVYSTENSPSEDQINQYQEQIQAIMDKNGVLVDKILHTEDIPMDPRHHSKVEYGQLRSQIQGK